MQIRSNQEKVDSTTHVIQSLANLNINKKSPFEFLFFYIKNNKTIKAKLDSIKDDAVEIEKTKSLALAIKNGDFNNHIFSDNNCCICLLYLIQENEIPFWQGMNVYMYLLALMQYTDKQTLRDEDKNVKVYYEFTVDRLVVNNELTTTGKAYLDELQNKFERILYDVDRQAIVDYILRLPTSDQWLLRVAKLRGIKRGDQYNRFAHAVFGNMPFIIECTYHLNKQNSKFQYFWIPSLNIIHYLLDKTFQNPLKMQPIYGSINTKTMRRLHEQDIHPTSIYATDVKSNPKTSHGYRCGPFINFLHDVSHAWMGSMLTFEQRNMIFSQFLPTLGKMLEIAIKHGDHELTTKLSFGIDDINDFNLSPIFDFTDKKTRFTLYIKRQFPSEMNEITLYEYLNKDKKIGKLLDDRLVFLVYKLQYENVINNQDMLLWQQLILAFYNRLRQPEIAKAISSLAKNAAKPLELKDDINDHDINWLEWLTILKSTQDSDEIWTKIKKERHKELLIMITKYHLPFFPPYLSLTEESRLVLIKFLEKKIRSEEISLQQSININKKM